MNTIQYHNYNEFLKGKRKKVSLIRRFIQRITPFMYWLLDQESCMQYDPRHHSTKVYVPRNTKAAKGYTPNVYRTRGFGTKEQGKSGYVTLNYICSNGDHFVAKRLQ